MDFVNNACFKRYGKFVTSDARASSARDQSLALVIEHVLFLQNYGFVCQSVLPFVHELSHLPKSSSKPLCKACRGCVVGSY